MHWPQGLPIIGRSNQHFNSNLGTSTKERSMLGLLRPVPVNWDVILVEQEAKATERSAVEEVLAADVRWVFFNIKTTWLLSSHV